MQFRQKKLCALKILFSYRKDSIRKQFFCRVWHKKKVSSSALLQKTVFRSLPFATWIKSWEQIAIHFLVQLQLVTRLLRRMYENTHLFLKKYPKYLVVCRCIDLLCPFRSFKLSYYGFLMTRLLVPHYFWDTFSSTPLKTNHNTLLLPFLLRPVKNIYSPGCERVVKS